MIYNKLFFLISFIFCSNFVFSQADYPQDYFRSPVDIPIYLSGNFGEIRSAHFHSGIDIKTQGVVGKNVYAAADGYISRIKVSPSGYGNALYITHPNGYVSVYGHLQSFKTIVEKYVLEQHYSKKKFSINLFPSSDKFPVSKGEIIGQSGNSGFSGGPHLHFEIRDAKTENPINPLLFGFEISDNISPKIYDLYIYPQNSHSFVDNRNYSKRIKLTGSKGKYVLQKNRTISLYGEIGFGLRTYDFLNDSHNRCGVYSVKVFVDSNLIYFHKLSEFSFSETSYIKSFIDYFEKEKHKRKVQKNFVEPNNKLSIYKEVKDRGIYEFIDDTFHTVSFEVKDAYENISTFKFKVKSSFPENIQADNDLKDYALAMPFQIQNTFENDKVKVIIPKNSLFDNLFFEYSSCSSDLFKYSEIHHIHNIYTPLNKAFTLSIKSDKIPEKYYDKSLIAILDEENKIINSIGGKLKNGYITAKSAQFGSFAIAIDTIVPEIKRLNIINGKDMSKYKNIKFKITDDLSGIKSFIGYIDESWVLFRYDLKKNTIFYNFSDNKIKKGKQHKLLLFVIDNKDNKASIEVDFFW